MLRRVRSGGSCGGTVRVLSPDDPHLRLPDHVGLSLAEACELLEVLDVAASTAQTEDSAIRSEVQLA